MEEFAEKCKSIMLQCSIAALPDLLMPVADGSRSKERKAGLHHETKALLALPAPRRYQKRTSASARKSESIFGKHDAQFLRAGAPFASERMRGALSI
ncbi:hypothetical protein [Mesorhizobium sp. 1M-11]|uniref:hypothetical protein n=1 Tax=Mesorhizobium sp. 1M-11 TaxID=1529006 RepID=UPI0006C7596B|nr:hypothetical protein [Mesorhizobium sp. 1M-11]